MSTERYLYHRWFFALAMLLCGILSWLRMSAGGGGVMWATHVDDKQGGRLGLSQTSLPQTATKTKNTTTTLEFWDNKPPDPQQEQEDHHHHHPSCLTFDRDIEKLVNETQQVFLTMLPKSSGTSLKNFVKACTDATEGIGKTEFLSLSPDIKRGIFTQSYNMPKVMTSFAQTNDLALIEFIKGMTDESLWIHLYRPETDRLLSAIKHVVKSRLCKGVTIGDLDVSIAKRNGNKCVIEENDLIHDVILKRKIEIGKSTPKILTCDLYDSIKENAPNVVFVSYEQSSRVQAAVARKYCPELEHRSSKLNVDADKNMQAYVKLVSTGENVLIDDWVKKKRNHLEWALELNKKITCKGTTRKIGQKIKSCPDGAISPLLLL